jgi:hypothetical protein
MLQKMSGVSKASLLGERAQIAAERALSEFRSGRPVLITSACSLRCVHKGRLVALDVARAEAAADRVVGHDQDAELDGAAAVDRSIFRTPRLAR